MMKSVPRRFLIAPLVGILGVLAVLTTASAYQNTTIYPSYNGCTVKQYAMAQTAPFMYAETYDTAGCATNVAAKAFYNISGSWYDTGWTIDPTSATALYQGSFSYGKGWAQIETGSGNWGAGGGFGTISETTILYPI